MHRNVPHTARACSLATLAIVLGLPSTVAALPLISEVFYDASGSDNGAVFVEIYGTAGTSLDGFSIEGVNGSNGSVGPVVLLSGSIPIDGFFVVADDRGDGQSDVPAADWIANFDFQNGPDSIILRDPDGGIVDAVGYGAFGPGEIFAGEGAPAPDVPAGSSLARVFADLDSDDNATDFQLSASPTPGSGPVSSIPEPASAGLLALGLVGLACLGRRKTV